MPESFKDRTTQDLVHELHRRGPMTPLGQIPQHLLDLRQSLIAKALPEEREAEQARLDAILEKARPALLEGVQKAWDYTEALRKELASRPHIPRPYQERAKRRELARVNRGQGKSRNR